MDSKTNNTVKKPRFPIRKRQKRSLAKSAQRFFVAGILTVLPLWITILLFKFLLDILAGAGQFLVRIVENIANRWFPTLSIVLEYEWVQFCLSVFGIVILIIAVGWFATRVIGRRLITYFDNVIAQIPLVQTIYGSIKKLIDAVQRQPDGLHRVVLIDFPSPEMKTVGFVTRTLKDDDTGEELAAVYVPTTPNPTSGYLEIVPVQKVISTAWTFDEAMSFIISGGAVAPERMNYSKSAGSPENPLPDNPPNSPE